jgi:hypothetical protein
VSYYAALLDVYAGSILFPETYADQDSAYTRLKMLYAEAITRQASGINHKYRVYGGSSAPSAPSVDTSWTAQGWSGPFTIHWTDAGGAHQETLANQEHYQIRLQGMKSSENPGEPSPHWGTYGDRVYSGGNQISGICLS